MTAESVMSTETPSETYPWRSGGVTLIMATSHLSRPERNRFCVSLQSYRQVVRESGMNRPAVVFTDEKQVMTKIPAYFSSM